MELITTYDKIIVLVCYCAHECIGCVIHTVHVCMYIVGSHDSCLLSQSEFYIELLKSLILEGQPNQAGILLKLREGGRVSNLTYNNMF